MRLAKGVPTQTAALWNQITVHMVEVMSQLKSDARSKHIPGYCSCVLNKGWLGSQEFCAVF